MPMVRRQSLPELTAQALREVLLAGGWGGTLPGEGKLALELGVGRNTLRAALRLLEAEGLLGKRAAGCSWAVAKSRSGGETKHVLRVGVLLHEPLVDENPGMQGTLMRVQHEIERAGHVCVLSKPCQASLRHDSRRIAKYLAEIRADAWVVVAPRRKVVEWFAEQPFPAIALGGGCSDANMAGTGTLVSSAHVEAFRRLLALGHRRIVMICLSHLRQPVPSAYVSRFTAELDSHHIPWSYPFNVPEWDETPAGFRALLTKLFTVSPPTALMIDETPRLVAALGSSRSVACGCRSVCHLSSGIGTALWRGEIRPSHTCTGTTRRWSGVSSAGSPPWPKAVLTGKRCCFRRSLCPAAASGLCSRHRDMEAAEHPAVRSVGHWHSDDDGIRVCFKIAWRDVHRHAIGIGRRTIR